VIENLRRANRRWKLFAIGEALVVAIVATVFFNMLSIQAQRARMSEQVARHEAAEATKVADTLRAQVRGGNR
jgi:hypothetical protein